MAEDMESDFIDFQRTERGFVLGKFIDTYGEKCSLQKSSLATEDHIWLGMDHGTHVEGQCLARMHLSRRLAEQLGRHLIYFANTGELP
jgi:hypothetical protein